MHTYIIGQTESGKSCIGKIMAHGLRKANQTVAVLDPLCDTGWECNLHTNMVDEFDTFARKQRNLFCFVDECGAVFNQGRDMTNEWWATQSRHYGHSFTFMSQRLIQVPPTMRDQCRKAFVFRVSVKDAQVLADEWGEPVLASAHKLAQFHCYSVSRFKPLERLRIVEYNSVEAWNESQPA